MPHPDLEAALYPSNRERAGVSMAADPVQPYPADTAHPAAATPMTVLMITVP